MVFCSDVLGWWQVTNERRFTGVPLWKAVSSVKKNDFIAINVWET
jgi:hypothetical protein